MRAPVITSGHPGRPVASLNRDARELLLTAATELFAEQGVAATTFATIAKRAGLTPAMLHYYFKDRDQLLDSVVEERLCPLLAYVWGPVEKSGDAADLVRGIARRLLEGIEQMPWVPSMWMREILNEGGLLRGRMLSRLPYAKIRIVSEAIAREQANHRLNSDLDPLLTVFSTLGMVMLHMATVKVVAEIFHRKPLSREIVGRHITGLLLDGLRHRGGKTTGKKRKR
jgi:AcrR family transcriptional regulator